MKATRTNLRKQLILLFGNKSNKKAAIALLKNWTAFLFCYYLIGRVVEDQTLILTLGLYLPLSFIASCCLRGFDNLVHEASHNNIFASTDLHQSLQFLFAFPVCKTVNNYRPGHFRHHRNYRIHKDDDPDTKQNIRWGIEFLPARVSLQLILWLYVIRLFVLYYLVDNIRYSFLPHVRSKDSIKERLIFWVIVLGVVALTHTWTLFVFGYIIPYFFWLPYIRFITESSKHTNVNLQDDFANSRNNIGVLHEIFLHPHNDGFHQMHHYASSIPFYNLKKAYIYMKQNIAGYDTLIESLSPYQTIQQIFKSNE